MSDTGYFGCLAVAIISVISAVVAARSLILTSVGCGAATMLAMSSCIGFAVTLPFRSTHEMPWLPGLSAVVFASIVLATILHLLCQIRNQTSDHREPEDRNTDR